MSPRLCAHDADVNRKTCGLCQRLWGCCRPCLASGFAPSVVWVCPDCRADALQPALRGSSAASSRLAPPPRNASKVQTGTEGQPGGFDPSSTEAPGALWAGSE